MATNDNYLVNNSYSWIVCSICGQSYSGWHNCSGYQILPNYTTWTVPEPKKIMSEHTLECGCVVEPVVKKHCGTLHKEPKTDE